MKANITYLNSLFDEEPKTITVYGKTREALLGLSYALGTDFVLTNFYITEDKTEDKTVVQNFDNK